MLLKKIAKILSQKGTLECLRKAETLEVDKSQTSSLNLRSLGLKTIDIVAITDILEKDNNGNFIKSISFSYNHLIGDMGATLIVKSLPAAICEIGLVDCGIGDKGGTEILNWMKGLTHLQMICMEQNNFSDQLKIKFRLFKKDNPKTTVIF